MKINVSQLRSANLMRLMTQVPAVVANVLSPGHVWLAGGALRAMFDRSQVADYDLFFLNKDSRDRTLEELKRSGAKVVFECPAGSMVTLVFGRLKIQLITPRYYRASETLIDTFDFTVCQFAFDGKTLTFSRKALFDARRKRLVIHALEYPIATINRIAKYRKKGYWMSEDQWIDLIHRIQATPFRPESLVLYID